MISFSIYFLTACSVPGVALEAVVLGENRIEKLSVLLETYSLATWGGPLDIEGKS